MWISRPDERKLTVLWPGLLRDLASLQGVEVTCHGHPCRMRIDLVGSAQAALAVAGFGPPPILTLLGSGEQSRPYMRSRAITMSGLNNC